jgi:drug/metabolite transporter (DMT)-like permease
MGLMTRHWTAYLALGASMALVGSYVALSKPLLAVFPVFVLAWLRFGVGAIAMAGWLKKPPAEPPLSSTTRRLIFLESFLGNFLFSVCMLFGMRHTTAVAAGIIMSAIPAVVAVMSWLFLREKVEWKSWAGIACAAVGIALYSAYKPEQTNEYHQALDANYSQFYMWLGNALILAAVVCEAAYAVIGKKLTEGLGPKRISALINLWGLALVTPLGAWFAWGFDFTAVEAPHWGLLLFYGLAASVWTVWLWMTGLKTVPASQAGLFTVMLPISAALTGVVFLGETISHVQLLAFAIALAGVVLATWPTRQVAG